MKKFDAAFRTELRQAVEAIEAVSGVELVVTVVPRVRTHWALHLLLGTVLSCVVLTLLNFLPMEFHYVLIYAETVAAYALGFALPWLFPGLVRLWLGARRHAECEDHARMLFQRAGMYETSRRAGLLIAWYWQERELVVLPDRGVEEWVPPAEWARLRAALAPAIRQADPAVALLAAVRDTAPLWQEWVPRHEDDINELPDELWLHGS